MGVDPADHHGSTLEERVAFLSRPESYPSRPARVEAVETHMAWVFLTDRHAWKLKKPVRGDYLDFRTVEARRLDCREELRLNRRLAPDVYLGVVPLTRDRQGQLQLAGDGEVGGEVVDWLVQMRRLPRERMLDAMIERHTVQRPDVRRAAEFLARFYRQAPPVGWGPAEYQSRLAVSIRENRRDLAGPLCRVPRTRIDAITDAQLGFLTEYSELVDARLREGKVIEAHGDLRPEHVCLIEPPAIIDCLEFRRELRILDAASELAFLALECRRLGAAWVGEVFFETYTELTGDRPPPPLTRFYQCWHACTRAKIALWHLRDDVVDPEKWHGRARWYLDIADTFRHTLGLYDPNAG